MNREEHGIARAGKVTGTLAHTVMYGGIEAWNTAIRQLWADKGAGFAKEVDGARGFGIEMEAVGAGKFWERHPEYDMSYKPWIDYHGKEKAFRGMVGVSPDRLLYIDSRLVAGLEIKSPTTAENIDSHIVKRDPRRSPHFCQCQHAMLVTGVKRWFQIVHFEKQYSEYCHEYDVAWQARYITKLNEFLRQYDGEAPKARHKLRLEDLES